MKKKRISASQLQKGLIHLLRETKGVAPLKEQKGFIHLHREKRQSVGPLKSKRNWAFGRPYIHIYSWVGLQF
jgi:hypothetical protein